MKHVSPGTLAALFAATILWASGCGTPAPVKEAGASEPGADAPHGAHGDHSDGGLEPADPSEHSVYLLPSSWTDQAGDGRELEDLAGRVQVVAMVYTHCSFSCPRILAQMKRIEGGVADADLDDGVGFTLVSIDPERDTPGRLATFAEQSRLDPSRWTLLSGDDHDIRALSVLLGVKYDRVSEEDFAHSNVITVLDPSGVPVHRIEGLDADTGPALEAVLEHARRHLHHDRDQEHHDQ